MYLITFLSLVTVSVFSSSNLTTVTNTATTASTTSSTNTASTTSSTDTASTTSSTNTAGTTSSTNTYSTTSSTNTATATSSSTSKTSTSTVATVPTTIATVDSSPKCMFGEWVSDSFVIYNVCYWTIPSKGFTTWSSAQKACTKDGGLMASISFEKLKERLSQLIVK